MVTKKIIGRAEYIWLIRDDIKRVPARIDTGARTSSIWATSIRETAKGLEYCLFGEDSPHYVGESVLEKHFSIIAVASSSGHVQMRYKVPLTLQLKGKRIRTFCTLADRSSQAYPVLIGRNTLRGKFIVDVQHGPRALDQLDRARYDELQLLM